jgi:hypothetical protein
MKRSIDSAIKQLAFCAGRFRGGGEDADAAKPALDLKTS